MLFLFNAAFAQTATTNDCMIPYRKGTHWGYSDTLGKILLAPRFDSCGFFTQTHKSPGMYAFAFENGKVGMINQDGQFVIAPDYDSLDFRYFSTYGCVRSNMGQKRGILNVNGQILIPNEYEDAYPFSRRYFLVENEGKRGLFHADGTPCAPLRFDRIYYQSLVNKKTRQSVFGCFLEEGEKTFLLSESDELQEITLSEWSDDDDVAAPDMAYEGYNQQQRTLPKVTGTLSRFPGMSALLYKIEENGYFGIVDASGNVVTPAKYDSIVYIGAQMGLFPFFCVYSGKKAGVLDHQNQIILPMKYDRVVFKNNLFITSKKGRKGCLFTNTIYPPIKPKYQELHYLYSIPVNSRWSFAILSVKKSGKWGFVGENGIEYFE
ncbi:MAG: WG repeat-containing protein [Lewinellaceae bacterium]|nr:WG repeat-containing protein [Lewinellaceae bacterium]